MATYTTNLNLEKPATSENFNLSKINSNWDKIDAGYGNLSSNGMFQVGDTYVTAGSNTPFRTLANNSGIYFAIRLPKACASGINSVTVSISGESNVWFSGGNIGAVAANATVSNVSLNQRRTVFFSVPTTSTISAAGFGICSLNATITFGS